MKAKEKSIFSVYKAYWDNGVKIMEYDKKIALFIKNYSINQIFVTYKRNNIRLKESEKKEFELMIMQLKEDKRQLVEESVNCTVDEYTAFLSHIFSKVDEEDRHCDITLNTSYTFKLVSDLIDVLTVWGEIPGEWIKLSKFYIKLIKIIEKYCKFKALDIYNCIKQGTQPNRGGPKDEEGDKRNVNNLSRLEISENITEEGKREDVSSAYNKSCSRLNIFEDKSCEVFDNLSTIKYSSNKPLIDIHPEGDVVKKEKMDDMFNFRRPIKQDKAFIPDYNSIKLLDRFNHNIFDNSHQDVQHTNCINNSMIKKEIKMDPKIQKKIPYSLPVKYKSIDYFRLTEIIIKLIETGFREIQSDKVDKSLVQLELAVYYMHNIEK